MLLFALVGFLLSQEHLYKKLYPLGYLYVVTKHTLSCEFPVLSSKPFCKFLSAKTYTLLIRGLVAKLDLRATTYTVTNHVNIQAEKIILQQYMRAKTSKPDKNVNCVQQFLPSNSLFL